jgi:hypothetical protein
VGSQGPRQVPSNKRERGWCQPGAAGYLLPASKHLRLTLPAMLSLPCTTRSRLRDGLRVWLPDTSHAATHAPLWRGARPGGGTHTSHGEGCCCACLSAGPWTWQPTVISGAMKCKCCCMQHPNELLPQAAPQTAPPRSQSHATLSALPAPAPRPTWPTGLPPAPARAPASSLSQSWGSTAPPQTSGGHAPRLQPV